MPVVIGYGPDGLECAAATPKCLAQSRLREGGEAPSFYARSYGARLVDPAESPLYGDAPFVRVSEAIFGKYLAFLATRKDQDYMAADRLFRVWS